jgi:hypothetical protein
MAEENNNLDNDQLEKDRYRFGGFRYSFRGPSMSMSDQIIPELPSLYAYPRVGLQSEESEEDSS